MSPVWETTKVELWWGDESTSPLLEQSTGAASALWAREYKYIRLSGRVLLHKTLSLVHTADFTLTV